MTRNANRTTKGERRFVRRYNPYAARALGIAQAARWYREGVLLDEARGFDNLVNDLKYGPVPLELNDLVNAAIDGQRDRLERILGVGPGMLTPTSSNVNHYSVHERILDLTAAVNARLNGYGAGLDQHKPEPLGPSECGHYEVVEETPSVDFLAVPYLSEPRPQLIPEDWPDTEGAEQGAWFAKYQAYREGRDAGEEYLEWNGDPWRDPNEVAAVHAEAIENALNDDIDPGD